MGIEDRVEIKRPRKGDENCFLVYHSNSFHRRNKETPERGRKRFTASSNKSLVYAEIKRPRKGDENDIFNFQFNYSPCRNKETPERGRKPQAPCLTYPRRRGRNKETPERGRKHHLIPLSFFRSCRNKETPERGRKHKLKVLYTLVRVVEIKRPRKGDENAVLDLYRP